MKNSLRIHKWTHNEFNIFILGVLTHPHLFRPHGASICRYGSEKRCDHLSNTSRCSLGGLGS